MNKNLKNVSLLSQLMIGVSIIIIMIISIFTSELYVPLQILIAIEMIIMAINNQFIYKRKFLTYLYLIFSLLIIITLIKG